MSADNEPDIPFQSELGILPDGKIALQFSRPITVMKMSPVTALKLAEGLVETVREANGSDVVFEAPKIITGVK